MVRRAAAESLGAMIALCSSKVVDDRLRVLFLRHFEDEQVQHSLSKGERLAVSALCSIDVSYIPYTRSSVGSPI